MKTIVTLYICCIYSIFSLQSREYHISPKGNDQNIGTISSRFKTIQAAANIAEPGDIIIVHEGTYREWVKPVNGGTSNHQRIIYQSAPGEKVFIKGSEQINTWEKENNGVWKVELSNDLFGDYNPYKELVKGDWFDSQGKTHHTGEVFLNNVSLYEVGSIQEVLSPDTIRSPRDPEGSQLVWYSESNEHSTIIWANFGKDNPNKELTEINVRPTCFYPLEQQINYITIKGFHFSQAATQWGAPTAEQIGMISTHWNKGWIIEDNIISNSKCSGITLGKERNSGNNVWSANPSKDGSLHYIEVTFNALRMGWSKDNIGSHIVRNNIISDCEQTGICGSMGCAFSEINNNHIYNIWVKRRFNGAEIAGIKFHAPIDTYIHNNRIQNSGRGIWLDWMTQGTRVSSNLLYNNSLQDLFIEVDHGPYLVDNNILLSSQAILEQSNGGAFVHNLIGGSIYGWDEFSRYTPYHLPHSTEIKGLSIISNGDHRFYNNIFIGENKENQKYGLYMYDKAKQPIYAFGNIFYKYTSPMKDKDQGKYIDFMPIFTIEETPIDVFISFNLGIEFNSGKTQIINTSNLGTAKLTDLPYENPDGSPLTINKDYLGNHRSSNPLPGPIEKIETGINRIKIWKLQNK